MKHFIVRKISDVWITKLNCGFCMEYIFQFFDKFALYALNSYF